MNSKLGLVLAAGGSSRRFGTKNKLFEELCSKPVFLHSLCNLAPAAAATVLVSSKADINHFKQCIKAYNAPSPLIVQGGQERSDSVLNGIEALPDYIEYVAVADAARPLSSPALLEKCLDFAVKYGSGVAAHRVTDTVKIASPDGIVVSTPDRSTLWAAETPQVFRKKELLQAYRHCKAEGIPVTDDAQAFQLAGFPVHLVENKSLNIKITTPDDIMLAEIYFTKND